MEKSQGVGRRRDVVLHGFAGDAEALRTAASSGDFAVRASALGGLVRCGSLAEADARSALSDQAPAVRRRLASLLATHPEAIDRGDRHDIVGALLRDDDNSVLEVACFAAGELETAAPDLINTLVTVATTHDDALCRESAVAALGSLGDPDGWPAVEHGCRDVPAVRRRAVLALVAFDHPRANELLRELCQDHDWQVRQAAEDLLSIE